MERPVIELEIREPTGLELGKFDILLIRQKIFEGELAPHCEWRDGDDAWRPLSEHAVFLEVFWLLGKDPDQERGKRVSKFSGWQKSGKRGKPEASVRLDRRTSRASKPGGVLGRVFGKKD